MSAPNGSKITKSRTRRSGVCFLNLNKKHVREIPKSAHISGNPRIAQCEHGCMGRKHENAATISNYAARSINKFWNSNLSIFLKILKPWFSKLLSVVVSDFQIYALELPVHRFVVKICFLHSFWITGSHSSLCFPTGSRTSQTHLPVNYLSSLIAFHTDPSRPALNSISDFYLS